MCGRHATGRSVAFWQAQPRRRHARAPTEPRLEADVRRRLARRRRRPCCARAGQLHLTGPCGDGFEGAAGSTASSPRAASTAPRSMPPFPACARNGPGRGTNASCADIDVAAFHAACLADVRRHGGTSAPMLRYAPPRTRRRRLAQSTPSAGPIDCRSCSSTPPGRGATRSRSAPESPGLGARTAPPHRRPAARRARGLRDLPLVTDLARELLFQGRRRQCHLGLPARRDPRRPLRRQPPKTSTSPSPSTASRRPSTGRSRRSSASGQACALSPPTGE